MQAAIEQFQTKSGIEIYRIPLEAFPGIIVYAYVVLGSGAPTLIDTGSGFGNCNQELLTAIEHLPHGFHASDLRRILVTHGHIDHFGGVSFMVEHSPDALVGIHALDKRVLTAYEERVVVATKDLRVYLERAGVKPDLRTTIIDMYGFAKKHTRSVKIDFLLEENVLFEGMRFFHTPGHCPGQVCILIEDILISADHVLARITPHQAPESITNYTGLGHYLTSLDKIEQIDGIRLALGGHESPIENVYERIGAIRISHARKLERILDIMREQGGPMTISDLSRTLYPNRHGYDILLAIEEVGAHVEYLYERGDLSVANLDQVEREDNPALLYTPT